MTEYTENSEPSVGYWKWKLLNYLLTSNRTLYRKLVIENLLDDFVEVRAIAAEEEYHTNFSAGAPEERSKELANAVLFKGIRFSREEHMESLLINHFKSDYDKLKIEHTKEIVHDLCFKMHSVYDKYINEVPETLDIIDEDLKSHVSAYINDHRRELFS